SSISSSGKPMLPASAVRYPPARNRRASNAVVVLLPFVPVTQIVRPSRSASCSANHNAVPPMKRVPRSAAARASSRYGLMPGDFTTTSKAASASASTCVRATSSGSPSDPTSCASSSLQNSVNASDGSRERSARYAARPSRPQPQRATRLPSSCEMRTQAVQQRGDVEFGRIELRADLAREAFDQRVFAPLRTLGQRRHRRARFAAFADAFERFVVLELEQRVVAGGLRRIVEQVAAKDTHEARLRHERREREEHEVALRAHAAPAIGRALAQQVEVA